MNQEVVWYYAPPQELADHGLPGVPLRDLTQADLAAMPGWLAASVPTSGLWTADPPAVRPAWATEEGATAWRAAVRGAGAEE